LLHTLKLNLTANSGNEQVSIDHVFFGPFPEQILIALVKNIAFVDSANTNPYNVRHYDMKNLELYLNGVQRPFEPLTIDCSSPFRATRAYETF